MPTQNVNLSEQQAKFIRQSVGGGQYRNASEVVRAGLRVLEQNEREDRIKLQTLRRLAKQAFDDIDNGKYVDVGPGGLEEFMDKLEAKARRKKS